MPKEKRTVMENENSTTDNKSDTIESGSKHLKSSDLLSRLFTDEEWALLENAPILTGAQGVH